jgi:hypothetical protein
MSEKETREAKVEAPKAEEAIATKAGESNGTRVPARKGRLKRPLIIIGCVVIVLAGVGIGGAIWHQDPSFCGALCHGPMSSYVEGYQSDNSALLITAHRQEGYDCLDCHDASLGEQIREATSYVSGNYTIPPAPSGIGDSAFCLDCHEFDEVITAGDDYTRIAASGRSSAYDSMNRGVNVHRSHEGNLECNSCHSMHGTSFMQCNNCHFLPLPEGWTDAYEGKGL